MIAVLRTADGGVCSYMKVLPMEIIISLFVIVFTALVMLGAIVCLVMEASDRLNSLREKAPWFVKLVERRESLNVLLFVCFFMMLGNGYELLIKEVPEVPQPPIVKIALPPAPIIPPPVKQPTPKQILVTPEWAFSPEKADAFINGTKTAVAKFTIITAIDDSESNRFGQQVYSLLKRSGWSTTDTEPVRTPWVGRFQGVTIRISHPDFQAAKDLQNAFKYLGLAAEGHLDSTIPPDVVQIDVGYKPDYWKY